MLFEFEEEKKTRNNFQLRFEAEKNLISDSPLQNNKYTFQT